MPLAEYNMDGAIVQVQIDTGVFREALIECHVDLNTATVQIRCDGLNDNAILTGLGWPTVPAENEILPVIRVENLIQGSNVGEWQE